MQPLGKALAVIGTIWLAVYVLLCFIYMTPNLTHMSVALDPVWRGWFIVPSFIIFIICLFAFDDSNSSGVRIQNSGRMIDRAIIREIEDNVEALWQRTNNSPKLMILRSPDRRTYTIHIIENSIDE